MFYMCVCVCGTGKETPPHHISPSKHFDSENFECLKLLLCKSDEFADMYYV